MQHSYTVSHWFKIDETLLFSGMLGIKITDQRTGNVASGPLELTKYNHLLCFLGANRYTDAHLDWWRMYG